jgi:uncharacterized protein (TIGR03492 family)
MPQPTRLLVVSNGYGEDSIAAAIIRRLPSHLATEAYPTLGQGSAYAGICPIVGPRAHIASEGWRNVKHSAIADLKGGSLTTVLPGLRYMRQARERYDQVLVIGDMTMIYAGWLTGLRNVVYVDVYKTGFGSQYMRIDKAIMKRVVRTAFCRAQSLADTLKAGGIDARAPGNLMMDAIPRQGLSLTRSRPLGLTILPGSRGHAVANFQQQVAALAGLRMDLMPDLFLAVASSLNIDDLASAAGLTQTGNRLTGRGLDIALVPGAAMGDAIDASDLVLSQAGTATVQAIGLGRPAVTFQTAVDRPKRIAEESRLFDEGRVLVPADTGAITRALEALLSDPSDRAHRAAIGRERIGPPGAIDAVIAELTR